MPARLGLRTADKPDSQDVCFIHSARGAGAASWPSASRCTPPSSSTPRAARCVGTVPAAELVTVGQRRGLGVSVDGHRRYALTVDVRERRITVGIVRRRRRRPASPSTSASWIGPPLAPGDRA